MSVIKSDLELHKSQLSDFLSKKYVDQPMLLGFTAVVQSKFYKWIQADIELLYASAAILHNGQREDSEFNLTKLLQILWAQFLHPIVKFYQRQHAELLSLLLLSSKNSKKEFKAVEMRKLNEFFAKFAKCVVSFYKKVLEYVMNTFSNPVITPSLFHDLEIPMSQKETSPPSTDFMASTMLVLYQCLLGLGNITRHSAHIDVTYVQPSKSYTHYQKFARKVPDARANKAYVKPLLYYSKCIQLFPQMCEAYNHIGVIYNSLNEKPNAVVWFLRSQFTLDQNKIIGKYNMATIFRKPWLETEYAAVVKKQSDDISTLDLQIVLLRIMGHLFYPEAYKKPLYCDKTSVDFITNIFFHSTPRPFVRDGENITDTLTVMMCFYLIAESEDLDEATTKSGSLLHRFIVNYLKHVSRWSPETRDDAGILKNVRFILAFCAELPSILKFGKEDIILALYGAISSFLDSDEDMKANILLAFPNSKKPFRFYLFTEDVKFKQFLPIGCKFHDFDDDHLLKSGDVNLLLGTCLTNLKDIPNFLDNAAVQRINKDSELDGGNRHQAIIDECSRLENSLRLQAIVFVSKTIFPDRFTVDGEAQTFALEKVDVPATQTQKSVFSKKVDNEKEKRRKEKNGKEKKSEKPSRRKNAKSSEVSAPTIPSEAPKVAASLDEIELMILGHASGFENNPSRDISTEGGLADMVNSILSENDNESQESPAGSVATPVKSVKDSHLQPEKESAPFTPPVQPYQTPLQMPPRPMAGPSIPMENFPPQAAPSFAYKPPGYFVTPTGYPYYSPFGRMGQPIPPMGQPLPMGQAIPMGQHMGQPAAQHMVQPNQPFYPPAPWQYDQKGNRSDGQVQYHQYQPYPQYQG